MSDTERFLRLLEAHTIRGLHSHDARRQGISGNPSQRAKDLASAGHSLRKRRENRNGRNGIRFWLTEHAPPGTDEVVPNHDAGVSGGIAPSPPSPAHSGAAEVVKPTEGARLFEVPHSPQSAITGDWEDEAA